MESSISSIQILIERLRQGDEDAAQQFVREYESFICRAIRPELTRFKLRSALDSADVCQSVLGSFLIRLAAGKFEIKSWQDLSQLLLGITRKKIAHLVRREYALRRDRSRLWSLAANYDPPAESGDQPANRVVENDLIDQVRQRLTMTESELFLLRLAGHDWDSISRQLGQSSIQLRKRLSRALRRVSEELALD